MAIRGTGNRCVPGFDTMRENEATC